MSALRHDSPQRDTAFCLRPAEGDLLAGNVSFTPREGFDEQEYALAIDELGFEVAK